MQEPWRNWWFSFWTIYNSRYVRLLFFCSLVPFKKQLKIVHFFAKEKKNQKTNSRHSLFTLSTPPFVWYNAHVRVLHFCHFVCDFFFGFRYYFFSSVSYNITYAKTRVRVYTYTPVWRDRVYINGRMSTSECTKIHIRLRKKKRVGRV